MLPTVFLWLISSVHNLVLPQMSSVTSGKSRRARFLKVFSAWRCSGHLLWNQWVKDSGTFENSTTCWSASLGTYTYIYNSLALTPSLPPFPMQTVKPHRGVARINASEVKRCQCPTVKRAKDALRLVYTRELANSQLGWISSALLCPIVDTLHAGFTGSSGRGANNAGLGPLLYNTTALSWIKFLLLLIFFHCILEVKKKYFGANKKTEEKMLSHSCTSEGEGSLSKINASNAVLMPRATWHSAPCCATEMHYSWQHLHLAGVGGPCDRCTKPCSTTAIGADSIYPHLRSYK